MIELELTESERSYAMRVVSASKGTTHLMAFFAAVLVPILAFAVYGVLRRDVVALVVAFAGLFLFQCWQLGSWLSLDAARDSLMRKVLGLPAKR